MWAKYSVRHLYAQRLIRRVCHKAVRFDIFVHNILISLKELNPDKTQLIWFGFHADLQKMATTDDSLRIDGFVIDNIESVRDVGLILS